MIRCAVPGARGGTSERPAGMSAATGSVTGRWTRSAARTAYPSIAELANGGNGIGETRSSASTRPRTSPRGTCSTGIAGSRAATSATWSATGRSAAGSPWS